MREQDGDFGLTQIGGLLGLLISLCQVMIGDGSRFTHAFVVIDALSGLGVEARPRGACLVHYREDYADREIVFSHMELTDEQRRRVVTEAKRMVGRGYNWFDYLALALAHWGLHPAWLVRYIGNTRRLICSQLVDYIYLRAGIHLFDDGRLPQDVTPGDLTYVGRIFSSARRRR